MKNGHSTVIIQNMIHGARVAEIASMMADTLTGMKNLTGRLRQLACLHDIGKVLINPRVLNKRTTLDKADWVEIRKHPMYSYEILKSSGYPEEECLIVRSHHEKLDGSGYPCGLHGIGSIPLESQIITIADIFDALTSKRAYRSKVYSSSEAIQIMRQDPGLNQSMVSAMEGILKIGRLIA